MTLLTQHSCRFCNATLKHTFLDLGATPLANSYVKDLTLHESSYPLHVFVCEDCFLVQVPSVVPANAIFSDYAYFSSFSSSWLVHAKDYVEKITQKLHLTQESFVVEVASNDGYLLKNFVAVHIPCLGIEPAQNVAKVARENGVPTQALFFGEATAKQLATQYKKANLILGNNVLAHVPDLNDFVAGLKALLATHGTITIEFPHLLELIRHTQFDTIYHEHYCYFSLLSLQKIFAANGLQIFDAEKLYTHGGSLRIYACHANDARAAQLLPSMQTILDEETQANLNSLAGYKGMQGKVDTIISAMKHFLSEQKQKGKVIVAYGAAAKGNTFLNVSGISTNLIAYCVDKSPYKQGHYLPGSHLSIHAPDKMRALKPDYILILPWNLEKEIRAEWHEATAWGAKFVTAIPELKIWG